MRGTIIYNQYGIVRLCQQQPHFVSCFSLLQRIKRNLGGEEGRCRCYEKDEELKLEEIETSHTLGGDVIHT